NRLLSNVFQAKSDFIILHTKESYKILNSRPDNNRLLYFFHPFFPGSTPINDEIKKDKIYDLLIWGKVRKSKGLEDFLTFLRNARKLDSYRIMVVGKF